MKRQALVASSRLALALAFAFGMGSAGWGCSPHGNQALYTTLPTSLHLTRRYALLPSSVPDVEIAQLLHMEDADQARDLEEIVHVEVAPDTHQIIVRIALDEDGKGRALLYRIERLLRQRGIAGARVDVDGVPIGEFVDTQPPVDGGARTL